MPSSSNFRPEIIPASVTVNSPFKVMRDRSLGDLPRNRLLSPSASNLFPVQVSVRLSNIRMPIFNAVHSSNSTPPTVVSTTLRLSLEFFSHFKSPLWLSWTLETSLRLLEPWTGTLFFKQIRDLIASLLNWNTPLQSHFKTIKNWLNSDQVEFFMVCVPWMSCQEKNTLLMQALQNRKLRWKGVFLNRSISSLQASPSENEEAFTLIHNLQKKESDFLTLFDDYPEMLRIQVPEYLKDNPNLEDLINVALAWNLPAL